MKIGDERKKPIKNPVAKRVVNPKEKTLVYFQYPVHSDCKIIENYWKVYACRNKSVVQITSANRVLPRRLWQN